MRTITIYIKQTIHHLNDVVFEFKNERLLEGIYENKIVTDQVRAEKALQATFKMLNKSPSTGMESLSYNKSFIETKPINYYLTNYYESKFLKTC